MKRHNAFLQHLILILSLVAYCPIDAGLTTEEMAAVVEQFKIPAELEGLKNSLDALFAEQDIKDTLIIPRSEMFVKLPSTVWGGPINGQSRISLFKMEHQTEAPYTTVDDYQAAQINYMQKRYNQIKSTLHDYAFRLERHQILAIPNGFANYELRIPLCSTLTHQNQSDELKTYGSVYQHLSPLFYKNAIETTARDIGLPLELQQAYLYHIPGQPEELVSKDSINYLIVQEKVQEMPLGYQQLTKIATIRYQLTHQAKQDLDALSVSFDLDEQECIKSILQQYSVSQRQFDYLKSLFHHATSQILSQHNVIPLIYGTCNKALYNLVSIMIGAGLWEFCSNNLFFKHRDGVTLDQQTLYAVLVEKPAFGGGDDGTRTIRTASDGEKMLYRADEIGFFHKDEQELQNNITCGLQELCRGIFNAYSIDRSWYAIHYPNL